MDELIGNFKNKCKQNFNIEHKLSHHFSVERLQNGPISFRIPILISTSDFSWKYTCVNFLRKHAWNNSKIKHNFKATDKKEMREFVKFPTKLIVNIRYFVTAVSRLLDFAYLSKI